MQGSRSKQVVHSMKPPQVNLKTPVQNINNMRNLLVVSGWYLSVHKSLQTAEQMIEQAQARGVQSTGTH